jgi:tripartite-type tricarboxylate transporter receptor subunit TctC
MQRRQFVQAATISAISAAVAPWMAAPAFAQSQKYPGAPVTIILPLQAGSASDVGVRHAAQALGTRMSASFVIENMAGAAGLVGLEKLSRARPDGLTLAALNNSIMTILPHLQPNQIKVDTRKEFVPIAGIANIPTFFAVPRNSPVKTVKDLIEMARKTPGDVTYSSGGIGSPQHLSTEMFQAYSGVKLLHVPYKGASQAALAVASSEVQVMSMALSLAQPFLADARVRLIGYCGTERHSQFPDIPTLDEQGVANFDYSSWVGLFAQKDVPADVVTLLRREVQAVVNDKALQDRLTGSGLDPWARSPEQLSQIVQNDYTRWQRIITDAKIKGA